MMQRFLVVSLVLACLGACATSANFPPDDTDSGMMGTDGGVCTSMCSNMCVDLKTDSMNCGKCGTTCPMGATCVQGSCQCMAGQTKCGNTCVDLKTDGTNCGKCGTICGNDAGAIMGGGMWQCVAGACTVVCPAPKTNCNNACVDIQTDMDNCGMCGNPCDPQTQQCTMGQCCKTTEKVCSGMCIDVQSDAKNCGMCGNVCPMNNPVCASGMCVNIPQTCKVVAGITWCQDTMVGRGCNAACTAVGFGNPAISDNAWLAAQNTQQLCTQIGAAFALSFNSLSSYTYGCAESSAGGIICSTYAQCPTTHRTQSDGSPWTAICPCK
jgi:hypothetical protein